MSLIINNKNDSMQYVDLTLNNLRFLQQNENKDEQSQELSHRIHNILQILKKYPELNDEKSHELDCLYKLIQNNDSKNGSKELRLFESVIKTPKLTIELSDGVRQFYTSSLILDAAYVQLLFKYKTNLPWNQINLKDFSCEDLEKVISCFKSEPKDRFELDDIWIMLHLAARLDAKRLQQRCAKLLLDHKDKLEVKQIASLLNDSVICEMKDVQLILEEQLAALIGEACHDSEKFSALMNDLKEALIAPISLDLQSTKITPQQLGQISQLPLRHLILRDCELLEKGCLKVLSGHAHLSLIDLSFNYWVTDACLQELTSLPKLEVLNLHYCENVTDAAGPAFSKMEVLKELKLSNTSVSHHVVASLPLSICGFSAESCKDFRDFQNGEASWQRLVNLKYLGLTGTSCSDATVLQLPSGLHTLKLALCSALSDGCSDALAQMSALIELDLSYTPISDVVVTKLPKGIQTLSLNGCENISEMCGRYLSTMTKLRRINLSNTGITDRTLKDLPRPLQVLDLTNCKGITDESILHLKEFQVENLFLVNTSIKKESYQEFLRLHPKCSQTTYY